MLYIKALHVIFVVTWFSGLFYVVRLFIYNREAQDKPPKEALILRNQYQIMINRLWLGITWPSAILTFIFGSTLLSTYENIPTWLWLKICLIVGLFTYHGTLHYIYKQQKEGHFSLTSKQLRIWNEVATVFLVGIVMLVIVRDSISLLWGLLGIFLFAMVLLTSIQVYQRLRK